MKSTFEPHAPVQTDRLTSRPWSTDDAAAAFRMYSDQEMVRYLGGLKAVESEEELRERIQTIIDRNNQLPLGFGSWPIISRATGEMVGLGILKPLPNDTKIEVGWHVLRSCWGKGLAPEFGAALIEYGFKYHNLDTIYAIVHPDNFASMRVAEKLGMEFIGFTEAYHNLRLRFYRLDQGAWKPTPSADAT